MRNIVITAILEKLNSRETFDYGRYTYPLEIILCHPISGKFKSRNATFKVSEDHLAKHSDTNLLAIYALIIAKFYEQR